MKKKIILISVTVLLVGALSVASVIFIPKYMKHSFSIASSDTVSREKSEVSDSSSENSVTEKTEVSQKSVSGKSQSKKSSAVSNSRGKSASAAASETAKTDEQPTEKITKFYKPAVKIGCSSTDMEEKMFYDGQSGKTLPYRIYLPKGAGGSKKTPILLLLHGAGERGSDNLTQIRNFKNAFTVAGDIIADSIIIAPQCPSYGWWSLDEGYNDENGWLGAVNRLLENVKSEYKGDDERIYVSGLSMGGIATWELLQRYPDRFTAAVPVCGGGDTSLAYRLTNIPIWIYHGTADTTVSFYASQDMYDAIVNAGGNMADFKILSGVGHNAWDAAYSDREMFSWLFAQTKKKSRAGDNSYKYIEKIKLVTPQNTVVFNENDIDYFSMELSSTDGYRMVATLKADAFEKLKNAYKNNPGKEFTVYYYGQRLYSFVPVKSPEYYEFLFAEEATEYIKSFVLN